MRRIIAFAILILSAGCGVAEQPESAETVAAFEVPLTGADDRHEFLALLSDVAQAEGFHVDFATDQELQVASKVYEQTINARVWRGADDEESIASVMDAPDHLAWIMFSRGESSSFRKRAMQRIEARWPETLSLPIMPTGSIPNPRDLIRTPSGYTVSSETLARFEAEERHIRSMYGGD